MGYVMTASFVVTVLRVANALQQDNQMQQVALQDKGRLFCLTSVMVT